MRLYVPALICASFDVSCAFTYNSISVKSLRKLTVSHSTERETDQYDDWYSDFDPSEFETYNQNSQSDSGGAQHGYTRDTSMDNSNVDLDEVNYLLSERLVMRKSRRFDEADAMRDELLEKHGVMVRDRESEWRSGCSASGSGRGWSPQGRQSNRSQRRKPKDFGPNGHDYNLARDAGPNQSSLSDPEIHQMLADRLDSKLNRDYSTADMIQEELLNAGVRINDKRKEWRADGANFGEFSSRKYNQSADSEFSADADQIQAMVDERSQAKAERIYKKADEIRDTLLNQFDVHVDDKRLEWSVGGNFGMMQNAGRKVLDRFERSPGSPETEDDDRIQKLVDERDAARANRDFDVADSIREELIAMDIFIDDRKRQWSVGGASDPGTYTRRGGGSLTDEESEEITQLLKKRFEYKNDQKFKSADKIRDQLKDTFNVQIDDRNKEWHVVTNEYKMSLLSSPVSDETQDMIEELVKQRAVAKLQEDYATADSIRDMLMEKYTVSIDDRVKEWRKLDSSGSDEENENLSSSVLDQDVEEDNAVENAQLEEESSALESPQMEDDDQEKNPETQVLESIEELQGWTVPLLKDKLRALELPVSGRKAELIERILGYESV